MYEDFWTLASPYSSIKSFLEVRANQLPDYVLDGDETSKVTPSGDRINILFWP